MTCASCGKNDAMPNCHYCYQCAKKAGLKKVIKIGKYFFKK